MENMLDSLSVIFTEFYYWVTIAFMFLIHVGFVMYEVGASRRRSMYHTLMKNTMAVPLVIITFYLFGWWLYFAMTNGPFLANIEDNGIVEAAFATPWSELMGMHMGGEAVQSSVEGQTMGWARINGVFFGAFLLFSITTASIVSGALIERIRTSAFLVLAVLIGSVLWIIDASWGWSSTGWMVRLGYHDAYASGVVHAIAGGFALGVLVILGPRIGKFCKDGSARNINPHNPLYVCIGLFLIFTGFWGFYVACNIPIMDIQEGDGTFFSATTIYLTPTTLSGITFNFLLSLSGGMMSSYIFSKGNPFWTYSGGLAGIIAASAGNDLYHPIQAFLIGASVPYVAYKLHYWVEKKFKIDDAVGAVAVHGYSGFIGVVLAGFLLWGYPSSPDPSYVAINPLTNFMGALIMFVGLGFIPGIIAAYILNKLNMLRVPPEVEVAGLDLSYIVELDKDKIDMLADQEHVARELNILNTDNKSKGE